MSVLTVYLGNSVLGGYFDSEFREPVRRLWHMTEAEECRFVAPVVTQQEAALAPSSVPWRLSMKAKTKEFDAVAESRKWKEAVAKETAGMTREETMAYFDPVAVRRRFKAALRQAKKGPGAEKSSRKAK